MLKVIKGRLRRKIENRLNIMEGEYGFIIGKRRFILTISGLNDIYQIIY